MTRNDTIILVIGCAILLIAVFVGVNRESNNIVALDTPSTLTQSPSSPLLNPNDATTPLVDSKGINSSSIIKLNEVPETGKRSSHEYKSGETVTATSEETTVSLTHVPYTGIGSSTKVLLFMIAMAVWTAGVSYFLVRRKALALR